MSRNAMNKTIIALARDCFDNDNAAYSTACNSFKTLDFESSKKITQKYFTHCIEIVNNRNAKHFVVWGHYNDIQLNIKTALFDSLDDYSKTALKQFATSINRNVTANEIEIIFDFINNSVEAALDDFFSTLDVLDYITNNFTLYSVNKVMKKRNRSK